MLSAVSTGADLTTRIREVFLRCPDEEMQLLNIAGRARFSGRLRDLRLTVEQLVAQGQLLMNRHGGGRYYRLRREA
ncbi:MAG: hypothetical protein EHM23_19085 [Acidobacteria bacterium]|nr:MAG: hypothetical protein EHM23_19085 [Acidobacteriota bacterium]